MDVISTEAYQHRSCAVTKGGRWHRSTATLTGRLAGWRTGFGGAQLLIGVDELAILYGTSALGREQMVETWRSGRRTPVDDVFAAIGQGRRHP